MQIVFGLIGVVLSLLVLIYRVPIKHFIGNIGWAESYFGPGGTYTALMLVGVGGFFISLIIMTGTLDWLLGSFVQHLFGSAK